MKMKFVNIASSVIVLSGIAMAGPVAYATCQAACAVSLAAPGGVAIYAACQSHCAALLVAPCP
ncbi:hypothetical protein HDV57DRAFT_490060 [Trichoderma longibrachiatum]|uniref:Uncharacterized protein n=1 Tax=Trichoderma longibrachiatum ATCC 18648 TaxID=983965 RepID=A0A2T4C4F3_TRILO|nr:hypothetical protein M440DRAFT_1401876 [Trichoderma longibrachiatum ATCC 18648]